MSVLVERTKKFAVLELKSLSTTRNNRPVQCASEKVPSSPLASSQSVDVEQLILTSLTNQGCITDTWVFALHHQLDHQVVIGAVKSLLVDTYVVDEPMSTICWSTTDSGKEILARGSPEYQVFVSIPPTGISPVELNAKLGEVAKIGLGPCMKNKWLKNQGDLITKLVDSVNDETASILQRVADYQNVSEEDLKNLKKRKLLKETVRKSYKVTKGPYFKPERVRKMAALTKDMLLPRREVRRKSCVFSRHLIMDQAAGFLRWTLE